MNTWAEFFATIDGMPEGDERDEYVDLLHRNFACGYPGAWPGFAEAPPALQERLETEWRAWALRDVDWIPLHPGGVS